ncbi:MAG: hypothetical protein VCA18_03615 [Opitutales bacterium]
MNRAADIVDLLRSGLDGLVEKQAGRPLSYTRLFDFETKRVSLCVESSDLETGISRLVGKVEVEEVPTNNGRVTCRCLMTDMKSGESKRVYLRIKDLRQKDQECDKIYEFFNDLIDPLPAPVNGSRGRHR